MVHRVCMHMCVDKTNLVACIDHPTKKRGASAWSAAGFLQGLNQAFGNGPQWRMGQTAMDFEIDLFKCWLRVSDLGVCISLPECTQLAWIPSENNQLTLNQCWTPKALELRAATLIVPIPIFKHWMLTGTYITWIIQCSKFNFQHLNFQGWRFNVITMDASGYLLCGPHYLLPSRYQSKHIHTCTQVLIVGGSNTSTTKYKLELELVLHIFEHYLCTTTMCTHICGELYINLNGWCRCLSTKTSGVYSNLKLSILCIQF